MLNIIKKVGI